MLHLFATTDSNVKCHLKIIDVNLNKMYICKFIYTLSFICICVKLYIN